MSALFIIFLTVSIYYYILYVFSIMSFLVSDTSSSSSTDDFDAVSRIEVFVSDSVLIISPFLLVHFTKKVTFFEGFHLILELFFSRHSNTQTNIYFFEQFCRFFHVLYNFPFQ